MATRTLLFDIQTTLDALDTAINRANEGATEASMEGMFVTEFALDNVVLELSKQRNVLRKMERRLTKRAEDHDD